MDIHLHHKTHVEEHFTAGDVIRDVVIGMSDGLTVPFALAAGISGAMASSHLVVTAGLAEVAAGSIAMGLGGYLAGRGEVEHYARELRREEDEIVHKTEFEEREVRDILIEYGLDAAEAEPVVQALKRHPDRWVEFMMRFELGLERPDPRRALWSALTIGLSYVVGGLFPLAPYMLISDSRTALYASVGLTLLALFVFGLVKGAMSGAPRLRSALQTTLIGGLAAAAAFVLARSIA
jgi:vacuolar iron transporter family protein